MCGEPVEPQGPTKAEAGRQAGGRAGGQAGRQADGRAGGRAGGQAGGQAGGHASRSLEPPVEADLLVQMETLNPKPQNPGPWVWLTCFDGEARRPMPQPKQWQAGGNTPPAARHGAGTVAAGLTCGLNLSTWITESPRNS